LSTLSLFDPPTPSRPFPVPHPTHSPARSPQLHHRSRAPVTRTTWAPLCVQAFAPRHQHLYDRFLCTAHGIRAFRLPYPHNVQRSFCATHFRTWLFAGISGPQGA
jgi:hypothetical protein